MKKSYLIAVLLMAFTIAGRAQYNYPFPGRISIDRNKGISFVGAMQDSIVFANTTIKQEDFAGPFSPSSIPYLFISKLDSNFNLIWFNVLGGDDWPYPTRTFDTKLANDRYGNTYFACNFNGSITLDTGVNVYPSGTEWNSAIVLAKYDSAGDLVWHKISRGVLDRSKVGLGIDTADNVYLNSEFNSWVAFGTDTAKTPPGSEGTFFMKFDTGGNLIWKKTIRGNKRNQDYATDIYGNTYVAGNCIDSQFCGTDTSYQADTSSYVAGCTATGSPQWQRVPVGTDHMGAAIGVGPDGKPVTAGVLKGDLYFNTAPPVFATGAEYNTFIAKYNDTGNAVWTTRALSPYVNPELEVDGQNNVYIAGGRNSTAAPLLQVDTTMVPAKPGEVFVVKLDSNGKVICNVNLRYLKVPTITFDRENYFYLTARRGYEFSFHPALAIFNSDTFYNSGNDQYIGKFDQNCQLVRMGQIHTPDISTENVPVISNSLVVDVFPNPAEDKLYIQFKNGVQVPAMIKLYDITGRAVYEAGTVRTKAEVNIAGLSSGLYLVEVTTADNRVVKKFVKR
jgi:hypothetical protein